MFLKKELFCSYELNCAYLAAKLLYNSKCPPEVFWENFIFSAPVQDQ